MNAKAIKIVGIGLLVVGVALLVIGVLTFLDFGDSATGQIVGGARQIDRALTGGGNVGLTTAEKEAILILIAGVFACIIGVGLIFAAKQRK